MNLVDKRIVFSKDFALLVQYAGTIGLRILIDQIMRTKREAKWNATHCRFQKNGIRCEGTPEDHAPGNEWGRFHQFKPIGIAQSTHCSGLAGDLYIIDDGKISNARTKYAKLGTFWKSLRPGNCWGGDFKGFADLGHFSREHRGRR